MRSRNPRLCGYPRCLRTNRLAFCRKTLFLCWRAPSSLPFRGSCPEWGFRTIVITDSERS